MVEFTLVSPSSGKYAEKGSTFSARAIPVLSIAQIKVQLIQLKEHYQDVSHICYGYRIKENNCLDEFATDAGEPKGSAGQPILNALKRNHLVNTVIFVIRYFGGSKLGIPGLINAYGTTSERAIEKGSIQIWVELERISFRYNYDLQRKVESILQKFKVVIINTDFGESITIIMKIEAEKSDELSQQLLEISNGTIKVKQSSFPANQNG